MFNRVYCPEKLLFSSAHTILSLFCRSNHYQRYFFSRFCWILLFIQDAWNRVSIWPLTTNLNSGLLAALLSVWVSILPYPMKKPLFWFINNWIENFLYTWKVKISSPITISSVCNIYCINLCRLALQAASRYSDFRLAENRYSAQTFIYLR
jgi:hypothetical protein